MCDHLNSLVGADHVFMDVEDIAPGQPFVKAIDDTIARCDTALIVIGPRWAEIFRTRAQQQQPDYVCHEIEAALERQITIVPVLVGGAGVAQLSGLSGKLSRLSQYQAAELRDSTFSEDCARLAKSLGLRPGRGGKLVLALLAAAILIGLLFAAMGVGPWREYRARKAAVEQMLATGRTQTDRENYEAAFRTYQGVLKVDPGNAAAMDMQLDAAMGWLQNFSLVAQEGAKPEDLAGARLAEIMPVLDAGLARANGQLPRAADILAHMGWAHWLNQHLAEREFGPAAERDLRQALRMDSSNVFAHAMLGNWIMQTGGRTEEALLHFRTAGEANRARPFVRRLQLGAMTYPRDTETRLALVRVVDEMRRNREPIDDRYRRRVLTLYSPTVNTEKELYDTLSAVSPGDAWAMYLWLDEQRTDGAGLDYRQMQRDFVHAAVLEIEHKQAEALASFQRLRSELKTRGYDGRIVNHVDSAIKRLSAPAQNHERTAAAPVAPSP